MLASLGQATARSRINILLLSLFLIIALLFGGASRVDVISLPIVRVASILLIAAALAQFDREQWRRVAKPAWFLVAVAAVIAAQLIPLPPGLWFALPGHDRFAEPLRLVGLADQWRPLSLAPDLTLNSLLAVLPPIAAVLSIGILDRSFIRPLVPMLLAGIVISAMVGLIQVAGGSLYFYRITNEGAAVGFFANRNHLAFLMALALPLAAVWGSLPHPDPAYRRLRFWLALCLSAAIFPLLLTTGSRGGLLVGVVGAVLAAALAIWRMRDEAAGDRRPWRALLPGLLPLLVGFAAVVATFLMARDVAVQRLSDSGPEIRLQFLPIYLEMVRDFWPTGAGFGAFDPVFRFYEPSETLTSSYLNQAHNDWLQILIEGGLPAAMLALVFVGWFLLRCWRLWTRKVRSPADLYARAGSVIVFQLLIASVVDYPLRTPFLAVVMAIGCCLMLPAPASSRNSSNGKDGVGSHGALG